MRTKIEKIREQRPQAIRAKIAQRVEGSKTKPLRTYQIPFSPFR